MKNLASTAIVAVVVSTLTATAVGVIAQEPAVVAPAAVSNVNADKVDGRHAVGAGASKQKRRKKLVATDKNGLLPSNIVRPFWGKLRDVPAGFADGIDNQGITKITITEVDGSAVLISAGGVADAIATCPGGSIAIGGGFSISADLIVRTSSRSGAASWSVEASNPSGGLRSLTAVATCMTTVPSGAIGTAGKRTRK